MLQEFFQELCWRDEWWPVSTQLEFSLKLCTDRPPRTLI